MKRRTALNPRNEARSINTDPTRIFVAAKSDFAIDGLLSLMKDSDEIKVLACVEPSDRCWQVFHQEEPDVLLLHADAAISPVHEFIDKIKKEMPNIHILVFGQKMPQMFLHELVMAGVDGYINEKMNSAHLLAAIKSVMTGGLWVERELLEKMAAQARQMQAFVEASILEKLESVRAHLTERETMVLRFVLEGMVTKEIAVAMHVSEQSVKLHLGNMFAKFNVTNRSQLILQMYSRVCPVNNMIRLFRMSLDRRRVKAGHPALLPDPLDFPIV